MSKVFLVTLFGFARLPMTKKSRLHVFFFYLFLHVHGVPPHSEVVSCILVVFIDRQQDGSTSTIHLSGSARGP